MQLTDSFTVPVSADVLWDVLVDVERIAPCVPGFQLQSVAGSTFSGAMKVKVGAISVAYDVDIEFVERDDAARRAVLRVRGKERRGAGSVAATVTASLTPRGEETQAEMITDVQVAGKVAQFGRGIMADVSSRVVEQFVARLNEQILAPSEGRNGSVPPPTSTAAARPAETASSAEPVLDLGSAALLPVLKRLAPALIGVGAGFLVGRASARRRD